MKSFTAFISNRTSDFHHIIDGSGGSEGTAQVKFGKTPCRVWPCNCHVSLLAVMSTLMSAASELPLSQGRSADRRGGRGGKCSAWSPTERRTVRSRLQPSGAMVPTDNPRRRGIPLLRATDFRLRSLATVWRMTKYRKVGPV